jgi:chromosome segregation ATPase
MTLEEALRRIDELEKEKAEIATELKRISDHREELREIAKRYLGYYKMLNYRLGKEIVRHERATAIIAEMGGYWD